MKNIMDEKRYDDIINLPHHKSATRRHMPLADRAAQFAPFAALTGYDDAVRETARLTERKTELDEYEKEKINSKLQYIREHIDKGLCIEVTYYIPDEKKSGGAYVTKCGRVERILGFERTIVFDDKTEVLIDSILSLDMV